MKLKNQLITITAFILLYVILNVMCYNIVTKRYFNNQSSEMKSRSINVSDYLPFEEDSQIVHIETDVKLTGDLPVIDGSAALYPVFSSFVDAIYPSDSVIFDGTDFTSDSALKYRNTRGAYKAVVDGDADIVFCAEPSKEQREYAKEQGVELTFVPIGYEAFVFIVGQNNPVDDLTVDEVKGLYSGSITNWSEVGGDDRLVDAVQRNVGSGSQTAMLAFMDGVEMHRSLNGILTGRAIGFSFRYYVQGLNKNPDVKILSINGIYPDEENIANGSYPITNYLYAVYDSSNDNPNIQVVMDFVLSDEGQQIIKESGYVPLQ